MLDHNFKVACEVEKLYNDIDKANDLTALRAIVTNSYDKSKVPEK